MHVMNEYIHLVVYTASLIDLTGVLINEPYMYNLNFTLPSMFLILDRLFLSNYEV